MSKSKESKLYLFRSSTYSKYIFANSFDEASSKFRKCIIKPTAVEVFEIKQKGVNR